MAGDESQRRYPYLPRQPCDDAHGTISRRSCTGHDCRWDITSTARGENSISRATLEAREALHLINVYTVTARDDPHCRIAIIDIAAFSCGDFEFPVISFQQVECRICLFLPGHALPDGRSVPENSASGLWRPWRSDTSPATCEPPAMSAIRDFRPSSKVL